MSKKAWNIPWHSPLKVIAKEFRRKMSGSRSQRVPHTKTSGRWRASRGGEEAMHKFYGRLTWRSSLNSTNGCARGLCWDKWQFPLRYHPSAGGPQMFHDNLQICNDDLYPWSRPLSYSIGMGGEHKMEGTVVRRVRAECPRCVGGRTEWKYVWHVPEPIVTDDLHTKTGTFEGTEQLPAALVMDNYCGWTSLS
jgi:hypothetical protein